MAPPTKNPPYIQNYLNRLQALRQAGQQPGGIYGLMQPDMNAVRAREEQLRGYLGATDYGKRLEEAQNMARLQAGLALAQRGFAAAGATPRRGESPFATVSRELLSPVAGDVGAVATNLMQQRAALDAAKAAEDRQLRATALQQVTSEDAGLRDLATKLSPKDASGLLETPYYVIQKGEDGKWSFVPQADGQGQVQVRQQKGTGAPFNIQTLKLQPLTSGQVLVKPSDLGRFGLGDPTGTKDAPGLQAGEFNLVNPDGSVFTVTENGQTRTPVYRAIVKGPNRGKFVDLGTNAIFSQEELKARGLSPRKITTGTAATPKGLDDPKFKASFRGMLAQMGNIQERQQLGTTAIRFNAAKFAANPELKSGANFPFERVAGVNQDGSVVTAPLTEEQQKTYADNLRAGYLNTFEAIKTGTQKTEDLNSRFIGTELRKSFPALGLGPLAERPEGVVRGRDQITNPVEITAAYRGAVPGFSTDVQGTLDNLPLPRSNDNLRSGTGRLVLFNELGVPFGQDTVSPQPVAPDADAAAVVSRANQVRGRDARAIQERIFAENIAKGTQVGSQLRAATADTESKKLNVLGEALEKEREKLEKAISSPGAAASVEVLNRSLEMLAQLQKLDFDMKQSGVTGFVTGPLEASIKKYLGADIGQYFRTPQGQQAANRFLATMPLTQQLFARDILREAGEQRYTNRDLEGAQSTLVKLNQSDDFNAATLRQLTGYLKNLVKSGLNAAGTMDISPATLEKAAMLGIDLKSITPKNNYYSPYFNQGKYAVTNQPIPQYSQEYMDALRDDGIFGYAAVRGTTGNTTAYKIIQIDARGNPIPINPDNLADGFKTEIIPVTEGVDWKTTIPQRQLDFNRNFLLKLYQLDR